MRILCAEKNVKWRGQIICIQMIVYVHVENVQKKKKIELIKTRKKNQNHFVSGHTI